jgi:UDP-2-acetamido-2,6-beta-L-arabino-hexul-4-ose reductase
MRIEEARILVTGAKGFIGKNLVAELKSRKAGEIMEFDVESDPKDLDLFTSSCDLVFHLAGVNRPKEEKEFAEGNFDFTERLLILLKMHNNKSPVLFSSSAQAALENPYGNSKKAAEDILCKYSMETGSPVRILRLPNVYGKWCRPAYNSVVATFCHNIANDLPITINNPDTILNLIYIDDVISELVNLTQSSPLQGCILIDNIKDVNTLSLSHLSTLLHSFRESRNNKSVPSLNDPLTKKLYATYLSYLPVNEFSYPLKMNTDNRGSFTEFIKTPDRGQVSMNISKPGIVKGNHWHNTKNEKFLVVSGSGIIRFRKVNTSDLIEYKVSGEKLEVLDIPPGYTHNIENIGTTDMVTVMWASEEFDAERPDTYYEEV